MLRIYRLTYEVNKNQNLQYYFSKTWVMHKTNKKDCMIKRVDFIKKPNNQETQYIVQQISNVLLLSQQKHVLTNERNFFFQNKTARF